MSFLVRLLLGEALGLVALFFTLPLLDVDLSEALLFACAVGLAIGIALEWTAERAGWVGKQ